MRAGSKTGLALVVLVFGAARPHYANLFADRRVGGVTSIEASADDPWPAITTG